MDTTDSKNELPTLLVDFTTSVLLTKHTINKIRRNLFSFLYSLYKLFIIFHCV